MKTQLHHDILRIIILILNEMGYPDDFDDNLILTENTLLVPELRFEQPDWEKLQQACDRRFNINTQILRIRRCMNLKELSEYLHSVITGKTNHYYAPGERAFGDSAPGEVNPGYDSAPGDTQDTSAESGEEAHTFDAPVVVAIYGKNGFITRAGFPCDEDALKFQTAWAALHCDNRLEWKKISGGEHDAY